MVKYLLTVGNKSAESYPEELHTALMEASIDGHVEVAKLLFDSGAQVNTILLITFRILYAIHV